MHCGICDSEDNNIWIDLRDGSWEPCYRCQEVIDDCNYVQDDDSMVDENGC